MAGLTDDPVQELVRLLARLPGIGEKSGARLAYFIVNHRSRYPEDLARAILEVRDRVKPCLVCGYPDSREPCRYCADDERDRSIIMVVEEPTDLDAMEKAMVYRGLYHVLGGTISPLAGKGPEQINAASLLSRLAKEDIKEVIIATNPSVEGDATAAWLEEGLARINNPPMVTRPARGVPVGSELKYMDPQSLGHALRGRRKEES